MTMLIDRKAVATRIAMQVPKFYHRYAELRAHPLNPFPGPVIGNGRGARWDPDAIDAWIKAGGEHATRSPRSAAPIAAVPADISALDIDGWRAELARRSERLAAEG